MHKANVLVLLLAIALACLFYAAGTFEYFLHHPVDAGVLVGIFMLILAFLLEYRKYCVVRRKLTTSLDTVLEVFTSPPESVSQKRMHRAVRMFESIVITARVRAIPHPVQELLNRAHDILSGNAAGTPEDLVKCIQEARILLDK